MEVLLFSGGIESTCLAFSRKPDVCLTINYGQRQAIGEIESATRIANFLGLKHLILEANVGSLGTGQMAGTPAIAQASIPEFWPFRNQFLVTVAAMKFANESNLKIIIGSTKSDASHVDGTDKFFRTLNSLIAMQEGSLEVVAPGIDQDAFEFLKSSNVNPDLLDLTFSCFVARYPCGRCRGCIKNEDLRSKYYALLPYCDLSKQHN